MLVALFTALIAIFGMSGSESIFLDPDVQKHVRKYVNDKERKDEILYIIKSFEKDTKGNRKEEEKLLKQFRGLSTERSHTENEFGEIIDELQQLRSFRQEKFTGSLIIVKGIIEEEEYKNIIAAIDNKIEKQLEDKEKHILKEDKRLIKLSEQLKGKIEDPERADEVVKVIEGASTNGADILRKMNEYNYKDSELFRKKHATEQAYKNAFQEFNALWLEYMELHISSYLELSELLEDNEWKVIKKYVSRTK